MTTPQKLYRCSCLSRTKKILQHRRQDQSQSQRIQGNQRRAESSLGAEITYTFYYNSHRNGCYRKILPKTNKCYS